MENLEIYFKEFMELIEVQKFSSEELDYTILEKHTAQLKLLSKIGNSSVSIFDLCKKEHVYSSGFYENFGDENEKSPKLIATYLDQIVHLNDSITLLKLWIESLKTCYSIPIEERKNYKIVNEYRIKKANGDYLRIIEQHQILELDKHGNIWLALSFIDISPDQDQNAGVRSSIFNFKTRELAWQTINKVKDSNVTLIKLSSREKQILSFIKEGLISKEIADKLFLSIHTVNTHRQRILEKLKVDNSMEAIRYASDLGLLD